MKKAKWNLISYRENPKGVVIGEYDFCLHANMALIEEVEKIIDALPKNRQKNHDYIKIIWDQFDVKKSTEFDRQ